MASIQIEFKSVTAGPFSTPYSHAYAVYTDDQGDKSYFSGGPLSNTLVYIPQVGPTVDSFGPYQLGTEDYPATPADNRTFFTVISGPDDVVGPKFDALMDGANSAIVAGIPCEAGPPSIFNNINSNSVIGTGLRAADLTFPDIGSINAPGFYNDLRETTAYQNYSLYHEFVEVAAQADAVIQQIFENIQSSNPVVGIDIGPGNVRDTYGASADGVTPIASGLASFTLDGPDLSGAPVFGAPDAAAPSPYGHGRGLLKCGCRL